MRKPRKTQEEYKVFLRNIIQMKREGKTTNEIAEKLNVSRITIYGLVNKMKQSGIKVPGIKKLNVEEAIQDLKIELENEEKLVS